MQVGKTIPNGTFTNIPSIRIGGLMDDDIWDWLHYVTDE